MTVTRNKIKNFVHEENDETIKNLGSYIENGDYYTSKKYGELIKIDDLKGSQNDKTINEALALMGESIDFAEKERLSVACLCLCFVSTVMVLVGLQKYMEDKEWIQFLGLSMLFLTVLGLIAIFYNKKSEKKLNEARKMDEHSYVLDKNGNEVKLIWFLYHHINFINKEERVKFLFENYSKYNYVLELGVEHYYKSDNNIKEYLSLLLKRKNEEYLGSDNNEQDVRNMIFSA